MATKVFHPKTAKPPVLPVRLGKPTIPRPASAFGRQVQLGPRRLAEQPPPWRTPPGWWAGSIPEWSVWWTLTVVFKLLPDIDFEYQASFLGGRQFVGGFLPDFVIYAGPVAINVDGVYVHTLRGTETEANDLLVTQILASRGIPLVHLLDVDLLRNPIELVRTALAGIQPPGQLLS